MLDCDASFVSVPEFASIRRALPARLKAATAFTQGAEAATGLPSDTALRALSLGTERQMAESFTSAPAAFVDHLPSDGLPAAALPSVAAQALPAVPPLADLRAEAAARYAPPPATPEDTRAAPGEDTAARPVTPRRPLRFTSARVVEDAAPVTQTSFNLFDGVFDEGGLLGPDVDPRLARSRARARAHITAMEAALTPEQRNLWHDDPAPEAAAPPAPEAITVPARSDAAEMAAPAPVRRHARHLTLAEITSRTARNTPQVHDPLRDQLHDLRAILYTPTAEELAEAARIAALPQRRPLSVALRHVALQMVALMLGLLLSALQALRAAVHTRPAPAATLSTPDMALDMAPEMAPVTSPVTAQPTAAFRRSPDLVARLRALWSGLRLGPAVGFTPRLATAAAALAALAIPIGALVPPGALPFL